MGRVPPPLLVAASLTGIQGVVTAMLAIAEAVNLNSDRAVMGITTSLFFAAYGIALVVCAVGMYRLHAWSRGPVLLAQLIWLGMAWSFRGGHTTVPAIVLAVAAVVVLAGLLNSASLRALDRPEHKHP